MVCPNRHQSRRDKEYEVDQGSNYLLKPWPHYGERLLKVSKRLAPPLGNTPSAIRPCTQRADASQSNGRTPHFMQRSKVTFTVLEVTNFTYMSQEARWDLGLGRRRAQHLEVLARRAYFTYLL